MSKQVRSTARDVFFYLLMIVTLYISVVSFITVLFQFVNVLVPDALDYYAQITMALRGGTAALFVTWPVFLFVSRVTEKDIAEAPEKLRLGIRRWLLYLTLFIAAMTVIIDLIVLMNEFMGGELTTRFFLKTIAILLVAAGIFGYYLKALKDTSKKKSYIRPVAIASSLLVYAAIIGAFVAVGSPAKQRAIRLDLERVEHLSSIQYQLTEYYREKQELPEQLTDMTTGVTPYIPPMDPENEASYLYNKTAERDFELCAEFTFDHKAGRNQSSRYATGGIQNDWEYEAGEYCFTRSIDPDFYSDEKPRPLEPIAY